jgi:hypothetical protein
MRNAPEVLYFVLKGAVCLCVIPFAPLSAASMLMTVGFMSLICAASFMAL